MKLQELINQIYHQPTIITPAAHASIRQLIESRLALSEPFVREPGHGMCGRVVEVEQMTIREGVAYIPIGGAIGQKLSPFNRGEGVVDVLDVRAELDQIEGDPQVRGAILDMDCPGGMFNGTPELADRIEQFSKPIYTFSRGMIASGGYWLAAATDGIFTTRTALVGSIGVLLPFIDQSKALEMKGIKVELITAGKLKGLGFPGTQLSDAGREYLQERALSIYKLFTSHVLARRGERIAEDTMQGQTFLAEDAIRRGLVDATVKDISEVAALI